MECHHWISVCAWAGPLMRVARASRPERGMNGLRMKCSCLGVRKAAGYRPRVTKPLHMCFHDMTTGVSTRGVGVCCAAVPSWVLYCHAGDCHTHERSHAAFADRKSTRLNSSHSSI